MQTGIRSILEYKRSMVKSGILEVGWFDPIDEILDLQILPETNIINLVVKRETILDISEKEQELHLIVTKWYRFLILHPC